MTKHRDITGEQLAAELAQLDLVLVAPEPEEPRAVDTEDDWPDPPTTVIGAARKGSQP